MVAVARAQKPPTEMPSKARAAMRTPKLGAAAIRTSDASIKAARAASTWRRSKRPAAVVMHRLEPTANRPEMEMACPAVPCVAPRSAAMGVSRLTGMNSEAMSSATHIVMAPTALQ